MTCYRQRQCGRRDWPESRRWSGLLLHSWCWLRHCRRRSHFRSATSSTFEPLLSYISQVAQGASWLTTAALAGFTAVAAREADRPVGAWTALALSMLTLLPPAFTGHAATAGDHDLAASSLVIHIVSVTLWVGGLLALVWYAWVDGRFISLAVRRFSPVALVCYIAIGISGVVNAVIRVHPLDELWSTGYGRILLAKTLAFVALGCIGWWHRQRTIPELEQGRVHAFRRFAVWEAAIMVSTIGLAVALAQTPPPASGRVAPPSPSEVLLGFPVPSAPTIAAILTGWRLDLLVVAVLAFGAISYGWGLRQLRRRGDAWPVGRAISWYTGLAILAFGTLSGLGEYGRVAFSIHMTQHMVLSMLAPIFLVSSSTVDVGLASPSSCGARPTCWTTRMVARRPRQHSGKSHHPPSHRVRALHHRAVRRLFQRSV